MEWRGHEHDGEWDPHVWLNPANAKAMATAMAQELAAADPANADRYAANAEVFSARLDGVEERLVARLAPVKDRPFIVFHDAYHYFEDRFDLRLAGSVSLSDAADPGPARVESVRALIKKDGAACIFTEPQFNARLVAQLTAGTNVGAAELDPLGADLTPGPDLYPMLLERLGAAIADCLGD